MISCRWMYVFFASRRRHTSSLCDWSADVCSSDLRPTVVPPHATACHEWPGVPGTQHAVVNPVVRRSEERRVGKDGTRRWRTYSLKQQTTDIKRAARSNL